MKSLVMVAHPDDCIIFAYSFMQKYHWHDYDVCYLTYTREHPRGRELATFWQKRQIPVTFLGYPDDWTSVRNHRLGFDAELASQSIQSAVANYDFVITHGADGEYGHVHHEFVHEVVSKCHARVITFKGIDQGNETIVIDHPDYRREELPNHYDIIVGFHVNKHMNCYHVPEQLRSRIGST